MASISCTGAPCTRKGISEAERRPRALILICETPPPPRSHPDALLVMGVSPQIQSMVFCPEAPAPEVPVPAAGPKSWPVLWRVPSQCEPDWEWHCGFAFPDTLPVLRPGHQPDYPAPWAGGQSIPGARPARLPTPPASVGGQTWTAGGQLPLWYRVPLATLGYQLEKDQF